MRQRIRREEAAEIKEASLPTAVGSEIIGDVGETCQLLQSPPAVVANSSSNGIPPAAEIRAFIDDVLDKAVSRLSISTGEQATETLQPASAQKV